MWFSIIKALPDPDKIAGLLINDSGKEYLSNLARKDNKKNIIRVRNKLEELKEGREIPEGYDIETVSENAESLLDDLNEYITGENKKAQTTLSKKLDKILKEQDKEGLVKFIGISRPRKMKNNVRKEKIALLKNNESKIREFIEEDDEDLFYTDNSKLKLIAEISEMDENSKSKIERIKTRLTDYPVNITEANNMVEVKLEDKTSYKNTIEILDILGIIKAKQFKRKDTKTDPSKILLFKKEGKYTLSPLLEIFNVGSQEKEIKRTVEEVEQKRYSNNVTGDEQVIGYLTFMTSRTVRTKIKFVPDPVINAATTRKTRNQIFGDPPIFSVSLRTIFTRPTFDLSQLTTQAEDQKNTKFISLKVRELLTTSTPITGLDTQLLEEIRTKWNAETDKQSKRNIKRFISGLSSEQQDLINEYVRGKTRTAASTFSQEEVDFIKNLSGQPNAIRRKLNEKFNKDIKGKLSLFGKIRKVKDILFTPSQNAYILNRQTDSKIMRQSGYTEIVKILQKLKVGETESVEEDLKSTLKDYNSDFKPSLSGSYSPSEMVHFLYLLDLYYGRTGFKKTANKFRNGSIGVDELIEDAQEKFEAIKTAFTNQVKIKVDDILENKAKYQKGLSLKRGRGRTKGVRNIFTILEENGVITER